MTAHDNADPVKLVPRHVQLRRSLEGKLAQCMERIGLDRDPEGDREYEVLKAELINLLGTHGLSEERDDPEAALWWGDAPE